MPHILIIEDDAFLSDIYVTKFERAGFSVDIAEDGEAGLRIARRDMPDVVLLDVVMPRMDGFEVLRALRRDKSFNETKIIMLTNLPQQEDVERGIRGGADAYIIKAQFTPTEVVSKVQEILTS